MDAPHIKTPKVVNEEEVVTSDTQNGTSMSSTVNLADLGITPVTPVTVGTVEQLQNSGGELNLRIIHDSEQQESRIPEVEAIKYNLKQVDKQLKSPRASVDGPLSPTQPQTPGSTASEQHLEDIEQVLIMDSLKDAIIQKQKTLPTPSPEKEPSTSASSPLWVSMEERRMTERMSYRDTSMIRSPNEQSDYMSTRSDFSVHGDEGQPVEEHWTQLNVQPPGGKYAPGENSMAAELLEQISAQGVAEKRAMNPNYDSDQYNFNTMDNDRMRGMRKLASAYINQLANRQVLSTL